MYTYNRAPGSIPDITLDLDHSQYVDWFWSVRGFCGSYENVMTPDILTQWQSHQGITLHKWERDLIFGCDRAFRHAYSDVLRWHMKRPKINITSDKDKKKIGRNTGVKNG